MIATVMFMMTAMLTMLPNSLWKAPQTAQQVAQWAVLSKVQWRSWHTAEVLPPAMLTGPRVAAALMAKRRVQLMAQPMV